MAKYHINDRGEAGRCNARKNCPFGDLTLDHYSSEDEARQAYEERMMKENMPSITKKPAHDSLMEKELVAKIEEMTFEEIEDFANSSPQNHAMLDRVIDYRAAEVLERYNKLDAINPYKNVEKPCDTDTFKSMKRELDYYKDKTATLVEAYNESPYYKPHYIEMEDHSRVGNVIEKTSYDPNTREWLEERHNTVGGSDVGTLALIDFQDSEKIMGWDRRSLSRVEESKRKLIDQEGVDKQIKASKSGQAGPLYRGNMWEDRIRDRFAKEHPEYTVMNTKSQYYNPEAPWQQVNFDGILSDREDKQPNGILELKTGNDAAKWEHIPLNYRAQVLYYLNASKLDYAIIGAQINDGEFRYFKLNRNDAVAPGKYDKPMSEYIKDRVEPWFNGLKAERAA